MAHCCKSFYLAALHISVCKGNVCLERLAILWIKRILLWKLSFSSHIALFNNEFFKLEMHYHSLCRK